MRHLTLEQLTDILEVMFIEQTIDSGFAIAHHGHIEGQPTIVISAFRDDSAGFVLQ